MFAHIVDYADTFCSRGAPETGSWNQVIRELVKISSQFPGGLSGAVIKGEVEQALLKESKKIHDIDNFDSALATTSLAANAVLELQCKLDYIPGTKVNVMLLRDFEGSRHIEMYCHQRFRVLSGPPWRDVVFGTKGETKLRITGLSYKKPRLLPNDNIIFVLDDAKALDGLVCFAGAPEASAVDGVAAFKGTILHIGSPESLRLANGLVKRVRIELTNSVDSSPLLLDFYETSTRMVDLIKKGAVLAIVNPIVQRSAGAVTIEYGTGTLLFELPKEKDTEFESLSNTKSAKIAGSQWQEMHMYPKRLSVADLGPHMRGVTLLGRVIMLRGHRAMRSSDGDNANAQNACLRITDESQACADVTLWEHLATDRFEPGQLILLENLWTKLGTSGRPVLSASPKHGAKLTNLSTFKPALSSPNLRTILPLSAATDQALSNFHSRATIVGWSQHDADLIAPAHRTCRRRIVGKSGSSYYCKHCDASVDEFEREEMFSMIFTLDDGIHRLEAVARDTVCEDIVGLTAGGFASLKPEEREYLLSATLGTQWDCSITCLSFSKKDPVYYLDCVIRCDNTILEASQEIEELSVAMKTRGLW